MDEETSLDENERDESAFIASHRAPKQSGSYKKHKKQQGKPDKSKITCYSCCRKGHYAKDCRNRLSKISRDSSQKVGTSHESIDYNAFSARIKETECKDMWIFNSGASAHMTYSFH